MFLALVALEGSLPYKMRATRITRRKALRHLMLMVPAIVALSGCGGKPPADSPLQMLNKDRANLAKSCRKLEDLVVNLRRETWLSVDDFKKLVESPQAPNDPRLNELYFLHGEWLAALKKFKDVMRRIAELEEPEPEESITVGDVTCREEIISTVREREPERSKWRTAQRDLQLLKGRIARINDDIRERRIEVLRGESQIDELVPKVREALADRDAEDRDYYEAYGRIERSVPKELTRLIGDRRRRHEPGHQRVVQGPEAARLPKGELLKLLGQPEELAIVEWTRFGGELAYIPAGSWFVGSPSDEAGRGDDEFKHEVRITTPFWLGVYPVTVKQALEWLNDETTEIDSSWIDTQSDCAPVKHAGAKFEAKDGVTDDHPMTHITFYGAQAYCKWLSAKEHAQYRLPSEAQWEYSVRAFCTSSLFFGNEDGDLDQYMSYGQGLRGKTHPVGDRKANLLGLKDMLGHVFEWCGDWYDSDYYTRGPYPHVDPKGPESGGARVVRGGSVSESSAECRCANRRFVRPDQSHCHLGFRIVRVCENGIGDSTQFLAEE